MCRYLLIALGLMLLIYGCAAGKPGDQPARAPAVVPVAQAAEGNQIAAAIALAKNRKIIYTAEVALVTENLDSLRTRLTSSVASFQGFIAAEQLSGKTGVQRTGIWTVRIPVDKFSDFMTEVVTWGELESQKIKSDDVTEEFVDIESRVKNKRVEEKRLLEILETKTGDLEQVVALERAISEVREQIERMDGRLRYLTEKVELTTITITAREIENYVPPQPPTFGTEIARTFHWSTRELLDCGKHLLLIAAAMTPWLVALVILFMPIRFVVRRLRYWAIPFAQEAKPPSKM